MNIKCLNKEHVRNKTECLDIKVLLDTNTVVKKKNLGNRAINNRWEKKRKLDILKNPNYKYLRKKYWKSRGNISKKKHRKMSQRWKILVCVLKSLWVHSMMDEKSRASRQCHCCDISGHWEQKEDPTNFEWQKQKALRNKMSDDFSTATLESKKQWNNGFKSWRKTHYGLEHYGCVPIMKSERRKASYIPLHFNP